MVLFLDRGSLKAPDGGNVWAGKSCWVPPLGGGEGAELVGSWTQLGRKKNAGRDPAGTQNPLSLDFSAKL